jgi:hypothetical protein
MAKLQATEAPLACAGCQKARPMPIHAAKAQKMIEMLLR